MRSRFTTLAAASLLALGAVGAQAAPINQIDYNLLTGTQLITFDDIAGGAAPGTNYDGLLRSGNTSFGERFAGQANNPASGFDVLSGAPSGPLALAFGAPGQNLNVFISSASQVLTGLGPLGFPSFDAIGEGSFAVLFDDDQSEFGFQLVGGEGGSATLDFFRRDGSLIQQIVVGGLANAFYGFAREGAIRDIAGISIWNNDSAGIGFDNLKHDVPGRNEIPLPGTLLLAGLALVAAGAARRRVDR